MIKKLKRKIILTILSIVFVIGFVCCIGISVYSISNITTELYSSMAVQLKNQQMEVGGGQMQKTAPTAICVVEYSIFSNTATILSEYYFIETSTLTQAINEVLNLDEKSGVLSSVNLVFYKQAGIGTIKIAFADNDYLKSETSNIWLLSIALFILFFIVMFALSLLLAKIIARPVEKSLEEQKQFIANASHELKTPLSVILANNKILQSSLKQNSKQQEWLKYNEDEIKHMSSLINDMLTVAQNDNNITLKKEKNNISKILNNVCLSFEAIAFEKSLSFDYLIEKNINYCCDEKMIKQLFMILIDNAIKYENAGGKVYVSLKCSSNCCLFMVNNTAVVAQDDLPHLFERFYRAEKSHTSSGFGLGLSIAKQIVEKHNGEIKVSSKQEKGTTFVVEL